MRAAMDYSGVAEAGVAKHGLVGRRAPEHDKAHRTARAYLAAHKVEEWLKARVEDLIVMQPENPLEFLQEALGMEIETRKRLEAVAGDRKDEQSISVTARIMVTGQSGAREEILFNKVANKDMLRGPRGNEMLRGWGHTVGSLVTDSLLNDGKAVVSEDREGSALAGTAAAETNEGGGAETVPPLEDLKGSASGRWTMPEEMEARLKKLFELTDKDKNGTIDSEEREEMRQQVSRLLIEYGVGAERFSKMPEGMAFGQFADWFVGEWETASKMQALADVDIVRIVAELLPGGKPEFPLGVLVDMNPERLARICNEEAAAALEMALLRKQAEVKEQADKIRMGRENLMEANSKFAIDGKGIRVAKFGSIEDFHKGIANQVGVFCVCVCLCMSVFRSWMCLLLLWPMLRGTCCSPAAHSWGRRVCSLVWACVQGR